MLGFTPAWIASFTLPEGTDRLELGDRACPGLRLRFGAREPPVFRWKVTQAGTRRYIQIGPWTSSGRPGHLTLAQAREWLRRLKKAASVGRLDLTEAELRARLDEGRERVSLERNAGQPPSRTVREVAEEWYQRRILPVRPLPNRSVGPSTRICSPPSATAYSPTWTSSNSAAWWTPWWIGERGRSPGPCSRTRSSCGDGRRAVGA